jgi:hypothetical protein
MVMHIPKDSELSVKPGECFDLIFDKAGNVSHDNKAHLDPAPPKHSVKAHDKTHHCAKQTGKVTVTFASGDPEQASTHTILIGN